jgi:hypothetical protein
MIKFYVYELYDKRTNWLLYIGSTTTSLGTRLCGHRSAPPNHILSLYTQEAGWDNIGIRLLARCKNRKQMLYSEGYYIGERAPPFNIIHQLRPPGALLRPTAPI